MGLYIFFSSKSYKFEQNNSNFGKLGLSEFHEINNLKVHDFEIKSISISNKLNILISCDIMNNIKIWDFKTFSLLHKFKNQNNVTNVKINEKRNKMIIIEKSPFIIIRNIINLKIENILKTNSSEIDEVYINSSGTKLIAGSKDGRIYFFKINDFETDKTFSNDMNTNSKSLYIMPTKILTFKNIGINKIELDELNNKIFVTFSDNTIRVVDIKTYEIEFILHGHTNGISNITLLNNSSKLLSADYSGNIKIWNIEYKKEPNITSNFDGLNDKNINKKYDCSYNGKYLAYCTNCYVKLLNIEKYSEKLIWEINYQEDIIFSSLQFHPNKNIIAIEINSKKIVLINFVNNLNEISKTEIFKIEDKNGVKETIIRDFKFSKDGKYILILTNNNDLIILQESDNSNYKKHKIIDFDKEITCYEIDNNNIIYSGFTDGTIKIYNLRENSLKTEFKASNSPILNLDINSNSKYLCSVNRNNTINVFNLEDFQEIYKFEKKVKYKESIFFISKYRLNLVNEIFDINKNKIIYNFGRGYLIKTKNDKYLIGIKKLSDFIFRVSSFEYYVYNINGKRVKKLPSYKPKHVIITKSNYVVEINKKNIKLYSLKNYLSNNIVLTNDLRNKTDLYSIDISIKPYNKFGYNIFNSKKNHLNNSFKILIKSFHKQTPYFFIIQTIIILFIAIIYNRSLEKWKRVGKKKNPSLITKVIIKMIRFSQMIINKGKIGNNKLNNRILSIICFIIQDIIQLLSLQFFVFFTMFILFFGMSPLVHQKIFFNLIYEAINIPFGIMSFPEYFKTNNMYYINSISIGVLIILIFDILIYYYKNGFRYTYVSYEKFNKNFLYLIGFRACFSTFITFSIFIIYITNFVILKEGIYSYPFSVFEVCLFLLLFIIFTIVLPGIFYLKKYFNKIKIILGYLFGWIGLFLGLFILWFYLCLIIIKLYYFIALSNVAIV